MAKNGFLIFDSDMHIMEPPDLWQRYIDERYKSAAPVGITSENVRDLRISWPDLAKIADGTGAGGTTINRRGHNYEKNQVLYKEHSSRGWDSYCQLEAMEAEGIDVAVMFPSRGLSVLTRPDIDAGLGAAIARAYNDWMYDFCSVDPNRMFGAGMISVYDINDAVAEARRAVQELGFKAVFVRSNVVNGRNWHDAWYDPLWETLQELDVPIGFHEASGSMSKQAGEHFDNFMLRRVYAQPFEQMMGLGSFVGGGVLERHPDLRVAFLEANCAWIPWLLWRIEEMHELELDAYMPELQESPIELFKRQCWVSIEPDEDPARYAIDYIGNDQLVFSTDYPHGDSRYPNAVTAFLELDITDEDKRKILWDNCARFYKVEAPVPV
ncbi:MAG: amidohydrolase family protein [Chloroflexi bacterium]|nr:amidohydrolase family protein [Chloroflexota bacterium]